MKGRIYWRELFRDLSLRFLRRELLVAHLLTLFILIFFWKVDFWFGTVIYAPLWFLVLMGVIVIRDLVEDVSRLIKKRRS